MKRVFLILIVLAVGILAAAQFFQPKSIRPKLSGTGRDLLSDPKLPPQVHAILERSCADCHSGNRALPWYGHVSPISWYLARHIERGRKKLDFSDWPHNDYDLRQNIADSADDRSMP